MEYDDDNLVTNFGLLECVKEHQDMLRYRWLAEQYSAGKETYLAESISSKEQLDDYIDKQRITKMIDNQGVIRNG